MELLYIESDLTKSYKSFKQLASAAGNVTVYRSLSVLIYTFLTVSIFVVSPESYAQSVCSRLFQAEDLMISVKTMQEISQFNQVEANTVADPVHRSSIRLHRDANNRPVKTQKVILIFHGLLNSPKWMKSLEDSGFVAGNNVLNIRLENHQELNRYSLDEVVYSQWLFQADRAMSLAKELGSEVILVGHSTGGVLALSSAFSNPNTVHNVFLMSPAIKLSTPLNFGLRMANGIGITGKHLEFILRRKFAKYLSVPGGIEVIELGNWYQEGAKDIDNFGVKIKPDQKQKISIVDSASDIVVDTKANEAFINLLRQYPDNFDTSYLSIPKSEKIKHDDVPQNNNSAHEEYVLKTFNDLIGE
ncbi:MAG: alpha/beta hydrolase-fold protein [Bdellovibrionota bacterium]